MHTNNHLQQNPGQRKNPLSNSGLSNQGNKNATIYDIASKLGISTATVSRALNSPDKVNRNTLKSVLDAATELGYTVNKNARDLRAKTASLHQFPRESVTIYTIAKKLGLSPSTVSRAFLKNSSISPKTKAYILQTTNALGYVPDENARKLRVNKKKILGVLIH